MEKLEPLSIIVEATLLHAQLAILQLIICYIHCKVLIFICASMQLISGVISAFSYITAALSQLFRIITIPKAFALARIPNHSFCHFQLLIRLFKNCLLS